MGKVLDQKTSTCYHCGELCEDETLNFNSLTFCCNGCKSVYELLTENNLCDYYSIDNTPGINQKKPILNNQFNYLDDEQVQQKLISYRDKEITKVTFFVPVMHCSSCIWLLESLYKIKEGIALSKVNFLKKEVSITYFNEQLSLREVVELLTSLGYEPAINLSNIEDEIKHKDSKKILYQMGVAGFCFGNIMLISFPEYFGLDAFTQSSFSKLFGYLNMALSLPVFVYSSRDYFINAFKGLRKKHISIDVPLALGILVLFVRSAYEVISETGIGYFDTHAGLVFFLLIGKWFQQKTFDTLSFERDYKSYFPVAVTAIKNGTEATVPVTNLKVGDRIMIRNNELIPADAILLLGSASIDFSFVTGESNPVSKVVGEIIYAGGRQVGSTIELEITKNVSQSYLTQLWNSEHFSKDAQSRIQTFQQTVSKYFTLALLFIAISAGIYWSIVNPALIWGAVTAVLIIACPCALALSSPFALGTAMRILGRHKFYIKSPEVVEQIAKTNTIVFDKTGTITQPDEAHITYIGEALSPKSKEAIAALTSNSVHPLSKKIKKHLNTPSSGQVKAYEEINGKGLSGIINRTRIKLGSFDFIFPGQDAVKMSAENPDLLATRVYIEIDGRVPGFFQLQHAYRNGLRELIGALKPHYDLHLLSGDNESEKIKLADFFGNSAQLYFRQSPSDKLQYIEKLRTQNKHVMMLGDGLNDAGALKAAHTGVSVTENTAHFSPSSDVIMDACKFEKMFNFIRFSKDTVKVIHMSFVISLIYNIIGLSFAVQGTLSPLIAAILMPLSSVTVIGFTTIATTLFSKQRNLS